MCDDLAATMFPWGSAGVDFEDAEEPRWGRVIRFRLPGGSRVGLYEPRHPLTTELLG